MPAFFENNIKKYRTSYGYTQHRLAEMIGGDDCQISRYENGEQLPPHEKLVKLASIFHVTVEELLGMGGKREYPFNEDGLPVISTKNAEIVRRQLFSRVNDCAVTMSPDGIRFSTSCVRKWEDTTYICITVDTVEKLLIVHASNEDDFDAQRWCVRRNGKTFGRKISGREFARRLYDFMKWCPGYMHKISGFQGVSKEDQSEKIWFFDLEEAEGWPMSAKSRTKAGVAEEEIEEKYRRQLESVEKQKKIEKEERKRIREEGKEPGPLRQFVVYPDKWGQYTFGEPEKERDENIRRCISAGRKT